MQKCPWPEPGIEEAAAVRFPASELTGGEGEVGERQEEIESYSEVVFSRSGAAGRGVGGEAELGAAVVLRRGSWVRLGPGSFVRVWGR